MDWLWLAAAGLCEVGWAIGLKSAGPKPSPVWAVTAALMISSFYLLWLAMRSIPLGTAYAVWTGIGAAGAAIAGMALFDEPRAPARLACLALIGAGVFGLKLAAGER